MTAAICWFRRDLRLRDNLALLEAARRGQNQVVALFIIDPELLAPVGPTRAAYLEATVQALNDELAGALTVREGRPEDVLRDVLSEVGARVVVATEDFAPRGRQRDAQVAESLASDGCTLVLVDSPYVVRPGTVVTKSGTPSKVFTPFRRYWEEQPLPAPQARPSDVEWLALSGVSVGRISSLAARRRPDYFGDLPDQVAHFDPRVGEVGAHAVLDEFVGKVANYDDERNFPAVSATSGLSPHLRFGTIHPRQVLARTNGTSRGADVFRSEIAWREFYADVLFHHPTSTWEPLQKVMDNLDVDRDAAAVQRFHAWARGETGYPLVDAGMRQLATEGWMHNRVRMVTASFLVKHLHLDWRWGAAWFMWCLVDGDVASNQHGWQWVAGTGTDAAPFHRVFNPTLQAERFDPTGEYVRRYIPALTTTAPDCLQPGGGSGLLVPVGYVAPIIDAARERDVALARYAAVRATPADAGKDR